MGPCTCIWDHMTSPHALSADMSERATKNKDWCSSHRPRLVSLHRPPRLEPDPNDVVNFYERSAPRAAARKAQFHDHSLHSRTCCLRSWQRGHEKSTEDTRAHAHAHMHTCTHAHMHTCTHAAPTRWYAMTHLNYSLSIRQFCDRRLCTSFGCHTCLGSARIVRQ